MSVFWALCGWGEHQVIIRDLGERVHDSKELPSGRSSFNSRHLGCIPFRSVCYSPGLPLAPGHREAGAAVTGELSARPPFCCFLCSLLFPGPLAAHWRPWSFRVGAGSFTAQTRVLWPGNTRVLCCVQCSVNVGRVGLAGGIFELCILLVFV